MNRSSQNRNFREKQCAQQKLCAWFLHPDLVGAGADYFAAAEATRTDVNMAGRTVNDCLYTLDIGLPGTVAAPVGVADLNTKSHALITKFTLSHLLHLLA